MSDTPSHEEGHEGPIKTPKQLVLAVLFAFLVPIIGIILLANFVNSAPKPAAGSEALAAQSVAERILPVGNVNLQAKDPNAAPKTGEEVYKAVCAACHAAGTLNSPKLQDAAAWGPRIGQGYDTLVNNAIKGKNAMPPRGGGDLSDFEVARAVVYMANASGGKLPEPKAPAGTPAGGGAAAPAAEAAPAAAPAAPAPAPAPAEPAASPAASAAPAAGAAYVEAAAGVVKLYFATGKSALPGEAQAALGKLAEEAKAGGKQFVISGFHDARGNKASNEKLAKARAVAARDVLVAAGVKAEQIEMKKPGNAEGEGPQARRVEISLK